MSRTQKLITLRARTDHDLLILVNRELDRGFALLDAATTRNSPPFAQAEKAYQTAKVLSVKVLGLDDRPEIEARLEKLRSRLDAVPACANPSAYPASIAS
ncbi:MAG TPA: hypothetical protein VLY04_05205 [Bryobacteraceae bacterium]|nr:hypothetical protein [Bryobacteraceae bacterium]